MINAAISSHAWLMHVQTLHLMRQTFLSSPLDIRFTQTSPKGPEAVPWLTIHHGQYVPRLTRPIPIEPFRLGRPRNTFSSSSSPPRHFHLSLRKNLKKNQRDGFPLQTAAAPPPPTPPASSTPPFYLLHLSQQPRARHGDITEPRVR